MANEASKVTLTDIQNAVKTRNAALAKARAASHDLWVLVESSDLSVSEIARELGVTRGAVYSWLRQHRGKTYKDS